MAGLLTKKLPDFVCLASVDKSVHNPVRKFVDKILTATKDNLCFFKYILYLYLLYLLLDCFFACKFCFGGYIEDTATPVFLVTLIRLCLATNLPALLFLWTTQKFLHIYKSAFAC